MYIVDAHLDLAYNVDRGRNVRQPARLQPIVDNEIATTGLPDLRDGGVRLICATIFCAPAFYIKGGYTTADEAHALARRQLAWYQQQVRDGEMTLIRSAAELPEPDASRSSAPGDPVPQSQGSASAIPFILLLEGADAFRTPEDVAPWFNDGLRIVGLSWRKNRMAGGTNAPGPITPEGQAIVRELDRHKIIHDTSHLAEASFWNLLELTGGPVIASHSNCQAIVPTDRQLSDAMIMALVERGGVIGINFYDQFLMPPDDYGKRRCTLNDVLAHIRRICDLAGNANHVAIGTDADGGLGREQMPREITTIAELPRLADALSASGFGDSDIQNIMGQNWLRFFGKHLPPTP